MCWFEHKRTIVVTGRGGTGKTTFTALLARYLHERGVEVDEVSPSAEGQGPTEELDGFTVHGHSLYGYPFTGPLFRRIGADIYHSQEPGWGMRLVKIKK